MTPERLGAIKEVTKRPIWSDPATLPWAKRSMDALIAEIERLRAELDAWTNYFGCDSPHDTDVMAETALGKEQARATEKQ